MEPGTSLEWLLGTAWLLPLVSFTLIVLFGPRMGRAGRYAGHVATAAIVTACVLSVIGLFGVWLPNHPVASAHHHAAHATDSHHAGPSPAAVRHGASLVGTVSRQVVWQQVRHASPVGGAHRAAVGEHTATGDTATQTPSYYSGDWYTLGQFGRLKLTIGYYIDALTVVMFVMVTLIASCIHFYSMGYMHEELEDVVDHEVTLDNGDPLRRRGRYHRFFQYLSLFSFSMLGVIIAGNMAMVFVFWELVGICSYFLIGFYFERKSASTAANKAFIVNRIGDFGMLVGLMIFWSGLGTFTFGDRQDDQGKVVLADDGMPAEPGMFTQLRSPANDHRLKTPDRMVWQALAGKRHEIERYFVPPWPRLGAMTAAAERTRRIDRWLGQLDRWRIERARWAEANREWIDANRDWIARTLASERVPVVPDDLADWAAAKRDGWVMAHAGRADRGLRAAIDRRFREQLPLWRDGEAPGDRTCYGHWLLILGGLGIFCGCVGKSAQFPLHVWLPDAMEGPTPVSALVHSATMVAAGVYLVGRFYPAFTPEVLLTIAYIGCITLVMAATIAITATDIKRVLAYSTVSQLGYMMLALGVGGWLAGMFHLLTHAFFKSLLFMCSGSVIHAVHTNEMTEMGGLRKKMPITAYTMLAGCLAIIGASVPFVVGFSGYYSKDAILEQAWLYSAGFAAGSIHGNSAHSVLFIAAAGGAALTSFYMFRLWFMTFTGEPRNKRRYEHAHESPRVMTTPLLVLAFFATVIGLPILGVTGVLEQARPAGTLATSAGGLVLTDLVVPSEHLSHVWAIKLPVTIIASLTAAGGVLLAAIIYCWRLLSADEIRQQFRAIYRFLIHKWWFDELYDQGFVRPLLLIGRGVAAFDRRVIDGVIHGTATATLWIARLEDAIVDRRLVDGLVNAVARRTWAAGVSLHSAQTGYLRQYVLFLAVGTVVLFLLITFVRAYAGVGP